VRYLEGGTEEARQRLDGILAVTPTNAEASFYLGLIDYDEEKFEEAVNRIHFAARLDPSLPDIRVWLAMAYLSTGQLRTARDLLDQVVRPGASRSRGKTAPPTASPTPGAPPGSGPQKSPASPAPTPAARPVG
jgi:predicted Zn-dependent protease